MRDIIFRGIGIKSREWVYGAYVPAMDEDSCDSIIDEQGEHHIVFSDTVGQYTGLKDKNGKEIYEGDILRSENGYAEPIGWSQDNAGFATMDFANGEYIYEIDQFLASTKTISGTIHDNPDLLK